MKLRGKQIGIAMVCVVLVLAALPWLFVRGIGVEFADVGVRVEDVPDAARSLFWLRIEGDGEPRLPEDSSLRLLRRVYEASEASDPALYLAIVAAIPHFPRNPGVDATRLSRLRYAAGIVWLSRRWTATQALTAVLESAHYGHRFRGIEAAAQGYYGRHAAELSYAELASLVVAANRVVKFNPWCRPSANGEAVSPLLGRIEPPIVDPGDPHARLLPVPEGKCPKR